MACKPFVFIGGDSLSAALAIGDTIPLSAVSCSRGCSVVKQGNAIIACGQCKAFKVFASFELTAASTEPITVTTLVDGVAAPGGIRTVTVAGASEQTPIDLQVVVCNGCKCSSTISFQISGATATLDGESVLVEQI